MFVSYAQNFEDVLLWRALRHVDRGFYIDVGAQDPVIDSVSLAFHNAGWRGIHVEPSAHYAELLRQRRPGDVVVQAAVSSAPSVVRFFEIAGSGVSTLDPVIAAQHRERGFVTEEKWVPTVSLESLFATCDVPDIHWLKIDVEGSEPSVVSSWGHAPQRPWLVVVESTLPMCQVESSEAWEFMLLDRGYRFAYFDGLNRYYVAQQQAALLEAFKSPPNVFDGFALSGTSSSTFHQHLMVRHEQQMAHSDAELAQLRHSIEQQGHEHMARLAAIEAQAAEQASVDAAKLAAAQQTAAEEVTSLQRTLEEREIRFESQTRLLNQHIQQLLDRIEAINAERLREAELRAAQRIRELESVLGGVAEWAERAHRLAQELGETRTALAVLQQKPLNRLFALLARERATYGRDDPSNERNATDDTTSPEPIPVTGLAPVRLADPTAMQNVVLNDLLVLNDVDFVRAAYRAVLKRSPDPSGQQNYLSRLKQGHDRVRMLADMANSEEGRRVKAVLPGLDRAVRWNTLGRLPVLGPVMIRLGSLFQRGYGR